MTIRNLDALFAPHSIALLGASRRPGSVGAVLAQNLIAGGFSGAVMLVNPKGGEIGGLRLYPDVAALPHAPDLAIIATPAETVAEAVGQLGARGCRAAVVISAGFEGPGGRPEALKRALLEAARPHLLRVIGPNCLGFLSPGSGINASFASRMAPFGRVALVAQSGAVAAAAMDSASERGFGFSHVVTVGDSADVDIGDLLDWLALDGATAGILLYVEGVTDARKFMSAARVAARTKPVAVLKAGRGASGAKAAFSHTGALAGAFAVYEAAFRRAGLLQVDTLGDLLEAGAAFSTGLREAGDKLAVLTNGGGAGVLTLDALELLGERACELSAETIADLDAIAPPNWSRGNPVDVLGDAGAPVYARALNTLLAAPEVDSVLVLNCPTAVTDSAEVASAVAEAAEDRAHKPVLTAWLGGENLAEARRRAIAAGLPAYSTPEDGARTYALLARARRNRELLVHAPPAAKQPPDPRRGRLIVATALNEGRLALTDPEARELLQAYGIPVLESRQASTPDEAGALALEIGAPVALKILSRQISHKTDVGGVALDLTGGQQVSAAAQSMLSRVTSERPEARIDGFIVEPMVHRAEARELIAGLVQDPTFGPVVMVGHGGVAVEVLADRALGLPPLNAELAREMIARTRVSRLLRAYRGRRAADIDALSTSLVALGRLASDLPEVVELDINPLLCDADGVLALDARVALRPPGEAGPRMAILPYPAELERAHVLDGASLTVRPVRPEDAERLSAMVAACSPMDVRFRFGAAMRRLWPELTASLTHIDYDRDMALVAEERDGELLGVARLCADPQGEAAEFAILVRSDRQGHGLGTLLFHDLVAYARARGLRTLWGETDRANEHMIELAADAGVRLCASEDPSRLRLLLELH